MAMNARENTPEFCELQLLSQYCVLTFFTGFAYHIQNSEKNLNIKFKSCYADFIFAIYPQNLYEIEYRNDPKFFGQIGVGKQCRPRSDCS